MWAVARRTRNFSHRGLAAAWPDHSANTTCEYDPVLGAAPLLASFGHHTALGTVESLRAALGMH